jgi:putative membrane protein insertion efficiency factor
MRSPHQRRPSLTITPSSVQFASSVLTLIPVFLIRCYQAALRPFLIGSCKFCPSCSEYAIEALQAHGPWRGAILAVRRVSRCHPFTPGGIDPVPAPPRQDADAGTLPEGKASD